MYLLEEAHSQYVGVGDCMTTFGGERWMDGRMNSNHFQFRSRLVCVYVIKSSDVICTSMS